jgi:hypothetical protein
LGFLVFFDSHCQIRQLSPELEKLQIWFEYQDWMRMERDLSHKLG